MRLFARWSGLRDRHDERHGRHDRVFTPKDVKANEMAYLITGLVEYQEHGKFSPRLGDRVIFIQAAMAAKGYSTGGRAPYGFARALVDADDGFVQWL